MLRSLIYGSVATSKESIVKATSSANWRRLSQHCLAYVLQGSRMSPRTLARTTGALSLLLLLGGIVAQGVIANGLVVPRDAVATANNILAQPKLYAFGYTMFLIEMAAQVAMTTLFYVLLRPVDRDRKSTRLNSSHSQISYAVFCLKKKKKKKKINTNKKKKKKKNKRS